MRRPQILCETPPDMLRFPARLSAGKSLWEYRDAILLLVIVVVAAVWLWPTGSTLRKTTRDLDFAIVGDGYFQISLGSHVAYTRKGRFNQNAHGELYFGSPGKRQL